MATEATHCAADDGRVVSVPNACVIYLNLLMRNLQEIKNVMENFVYL